MTINLSHTDTVVIHLSDSWQNNFFIKVVKMGNPSVADNSRTFPCREKYRVARRPLIIWAILGPRKRMTSLADTIILEEAGQ